MSGRGVIRRAAVLLTAVGANLSKHVVASGRRCGFASRSGTAAHTASGWRGTDLRSAMAMQLGDRPARSGSPSVARCPPLGRDDLECELEYASVKLLGELRDTHDPVG
jgi:hypothetical protein